MDFGTAVVDGGLVAMFVASAGSGDKQYCAGFDSKLTRPRRGGGEASATCVAAHVSKLGRIYGANRFCMDAKDEVSSAR